MEHKPHCSFYQIRPFKLTISMIKQEKFRYTFITSQVPNHILTSIYCWFYLLKQVMFFRTQTNFLKKERSISKFSCRKTTQLIISNTFPNNESSVFFILICYQIDGAHINYTCHDFGLPSKYVAEFNSGIIFLISLCTFDIIV